MKLFSLTEAPRTKFRPKDGPVHSFGYENWHTDKRPKVLYLGKWRHPTTKNMLIGGINLNKLNSKELAIIQSALPEIYPPDFTSSFFTTAGMKGVGSLKANYDRLKSIAPWIVSSGRYQTWDKKYVNSITVDTLKFIDPDEIENTADAIDKKHPAYAEPESMEKDLEGDAATQDLVAKSSNPRELAKKPSELKSRKITQAPSKEGQQEPPPEQEQPPEQPKEPELPPVPNTPSTPGFKVSASAMDIAKINNTNAVPTAGGVVKKPDTLTGNAVKPSGNAAPGADKAMAARIKKK